jgi:hypothetical protein
MYIVFMEVVDNNSAKVISYKDVIVVARKLWNYFHLLYFAIYLVLL